MFYNYTKLSFFLLQTIKRHHPFCPFGTKTRWLVASLANSFKNFLCSPREVGLILFSLIQKLENNRSNQNNCTEYTTQRNTGAFLSSWGYKMTSLTALSTRQNSSFLSLRSGWTIQGCTFYIFHWNKPASWENRLTILTCAQCNSLKTKTRHKQDDFCRVCESCWTSELCTLNLLKESQSKKTSQCKIISVFIHVLGK